MPKQKKHAAAKAQKARRTQREETKKTAKPISVLRQVTHSEDFDEHRKAARLDIPIKVQYRIIGNGDIGTKGAVTKDISVGGCLLLVAEKLPMGADIELDISLGETRAEALKLKGKVTRLNRQEKGLCEYGISFAGLSSEARRLFADFCFAKMYEMIGLSEWPTDKRVKK